MLTYSLHAVVNVPFVFFFFFFTISTSLLRLTIYSVTAIRVSFNSLNLFIIAALKSLLTSEPTQESMSSASYSNLNLTPQCLISTSAPKTVGGTSLVVRG